MKRLPVGGSFIRGLAAGLAVFACVTAAKAHPYASCLTNFTAGGTNFVSFYLNESLGAVTVVTYPSQTTNSLGTLNSGPSSFALPSGDTSYTISVTKTGAGLPTLLTQDASFDVWNGGAVGRAIGVNQCAQFGDAFGRVNIGLTGQTATDSSAPAFRGWGVYALTPDMINNALYGGKNPTPACAVMQSNTLTFTTFATNGATFVMDGVTLTWSTNATNIATQVAVTNSAAAAATNLAAALNANLASHAGTVSVTVSGSVVSMLQFAQATSGASYFTYATPGLFGPFANDFSTGDAGFGSGPYRMFVSPEDGTVWVTDATDGNANAYIFGRNYESTNNLWTVTGRIPGEGVHEHGNINDIAVRGTIAKGNLQVWTADNDLTIPAYFNNTNLGTMGNGGVGNFGSPQETVVGDANEIYRYDIGAGAPGYPVTNTPLFACTLGLDGGFADSQVDCVTVGPNTNYVYASFRRANASDGNLQVFRADTGARVYDSIGGTPLAPTDIFATDGNGVEGIYGGIRVSPDGRFIAAMLIDNEVLVANLTNGIPDSSSIFMITNTPSGATGRQVCWDAADNIYTINNSGQNLARCYSLGLSTTCVTSNDVTGTNGSFQIVLPPADVTLANAGNASQNYGTPITGNVNVNMGTSSLSSPVTVNFTIGGTGVNEVNYNITPGTDANNVVLVTNTGNTGTITFPAGPFGGVGNWNANIPITPTATPLIGPTFTVVVKLSPGPTYISGSPGTATVVISNTGPQLFFVSASPTATTMSRAITNDYAECILNRWGDIEGPGNSAGSVMPKTITLTNFTLAGTAIFPTDYTAGVQPFVPGNPPVDGSASVAFAPGVSSLTVLVGNPVSHANALQATTNVTIIPTLTNSVTGTNCTSLEGFAYFVTAASATLTEFDNAQGTLAEVVLWSDPLTNSTGVSSNYAVTYGGGNMGTNSVLPSYFPNYLYTNGGSPNGSAAALGTSSTSNCFDVQLGWPIGSENAWETSQGTFPGSPYPNPPPSTVMANNGWSNVLRMTVDKAVYQNPSQCGLNFFPTTNQFVGNYALRFDMYLSIWSGALANPAPLSYPRNFAAFGVNTEGTNCDWRVSIPAGYPNANNPTNADGLWYCIDAADSSLTPADFDGFASPALPNNGTSDFVSSTAANENGVFKRPPFPTTDGVSSGTPINQWANVSVETRQTNVAMLVDNTAIFPNMGLTNNATTAPNNLLAVPSGNWSNGVPMLGYLQPYAFQSDESAFVYYSNVRVVELAPYVLNQLCSQLVLAGSTVTLPSVATYASQNLTNTWFRGTTAPATVVATHDVTGTNFTLNGVSYYGTNDALVLNNVTTGSNYWAVWSDQAGSITSSVANVVVVAPPPATVNVAAGAKATLAVTTSAPSGVTVVTYQWKTNGVNLANSTKYTNVTTASLGVSNCQSADTLASYTCTVSCLTTNLVGLYLNTNNVLTLTTPAASLAINLVVAPASTNALWGSSVTFSVTGGSGPLPYTYQWLVGGVDIANATASTLTVSNITGIGTTNLYTCAVTNSAASGAVSSAGKLIVTEPKPTISPALVLSGGNVALNFTSTNTHDTTNGFILQSSPVAQGPYTNDPSATFTTTGGGNFQVTAPQTANANMFYRLLHVP